MNIYKITNLVNSKIYVGKTIFPLEKRLRQHIVSSNSEIRKAKSPILRAICKYGKDNFKIELLDTATSSLELAQKEAYWISKLNSTNKTIGYNIISWDGSFQEVYNDEMRFKVRATRKDNKPSSGFHSKYAGVSFDISRNTWFFEFKYKEKSVRQRGFATEKDAAIGRDIYILKTYGDKDYVINSINIPVNIELYRSNNIKVNRSLKIANKKSKYNSVMYEKTINQWLVCIIADNNKVYKKGMFILEEDAAFMADIMYLEIYGEKHDPKLINFPDKLKDYLAGQLPKPLTLTEKFRLTHPYTFIRSVNSYKKNAKKVFEVDARSTGFKIRKRFPDLQSAIQFRNENLIKNGLPIPD
jgi:group I intron endonuclease